MASLFVKISLWTNTFCISDNDDTSKNTIKSPKVILMLISILGLEHHHMYNFLAWTKLLPFIFYSDFWNVHQQLFVI